MANDFRLPSASRRSFLSLSAAASAALALRVVTEPMLARARVHNFPKDAVLIDANENPLGPCSSAREAIAAITPQGGRYMDGLTDDLVKQIGQMEGLKTDYITVQAGSTELLHHTVCAFTSPQRSYVAADPGFEGGTFAAKTIGAGVVKVPLTKSYAHDVKAMLAAGTDAGVFYVCLPNNPTGTLTSHSDIEYLVNNKPKGSVVLVDEAYIHFSDAVSAVDLVKADKEVIVLRTFSKLYGMAGLRCGFAMGRPDLLEKMYSYGGGNFMPITAMVAASASLQHAGLVQERKKINADIREEVFQWLDHHGYSYVRSQSNCFMLDTKRPAKEAIDAMAKQKVFIGRIWPVWPTYARITVGTAPEMEQFQTAWQKVMSGAVTASVGAMPSAGELGRRRRNLNGIVRGA
jgi:histidinol-phosphate aminotransferase